MKQKLLTRMLLVAVALLGGASNVWAGDVTTLYGRAVTADLVNGYTAWSSDADVSTSAVSGKWRAQGAADGYPVTCDGTYGLLLPTKDCSYTVTYSNISPTDGAILTYDAVWGFTTGNKASNNSSICFGDGIVIKGCGQAKTLTLEVNGGTVSLGTTNASRWSDELTIHMVVNTFSKKITSLTITSASNPTTINYSNTEDIAVASSATFTTLKLATNRGQSGLNTGGYLKSIRVKNETQDVSAVNYTVKFQDGDGHTLKDDVIHDNGVVGDVYQATAEDMETFYNDADVASATMKYVYKSGQNTSVVASSTASENVITLVFDVYNKTDYTVNAQAGGSDIKTGIATGSAFLDGSTTAYWNKYLKVGSQWYVADEATYGAGIAAATTNVAYTATDAIDDFYEYEALSNSGTMVGGTTGTAVSGGNSQRFGQYGKKWTPALAGGTYTIDLYCFGNNGKSVTLPVYYSDSDGSNEVYIGEATACEASTWALKTTTNVVVPEGKSLCFYNNSNYTHNYMVDYLTLKRTGDATVSKTITDAGWATYCSPYALDLQNATGLTDAYIVTGGADRVLAKTSVKGGTVPANTGLLLKGSEGTVTIPVVASSSTNVSSNKLIGKTASYNLEANDGYVLMNDATYGLAFYKNQNVFTVGANTAYLPANFTDSVAGARSFFSLFNAETTGIEDAVKSKEIKDKIFYNLSGQRVKKATKGLYIVNGKKYVK